MARMAETLSLDLGVEYDARIVSRRQLDRAVERCNDCADPDGCAVWLDDHAGGAQEAPNLCPNKALFDHMRDGW
tara:strand:+ start:40506 stop:40727 length:222 start_codon:yes stop_codon:yes gene_type:complete